ncbi:MAG: AtpZ/AtpI family protein [Lachnospiraceae bacterium]|nr:AtpZ/AtpI family protein [Lachnospiraceae bacterium]
MKKGGYERSVFRSLALISQFSINMIVPMVLCMFLGLFLDKKLDTSYWTIILFFVGALAGFNSIYKMAKRIYKDKSGEENDRKN